MGTNMLFTISGDNTNEIQALMSESVVQPFLPYVVYEGFC